MSIPWTDRFLLSLAPPAAAAVIRLLFATMRLEWVGQDIPHSFWQRGDHVICSFWHDQLLLMAKSIEADAKVLISASKDGELIARTIGYFGIGSIRGSSTRGGDRAFRELLKEARQPTELVVTPDGPKGPRHQLKEGVVHLARLTGRPVIPLAFACSRGRRFASWDRFLLPYPLARGVFVFGEPVAIAKAEDPISARARLQQAMDEVNRKAASCLESRGVSVV